MKSLYWAGILLGLGSLAMMARGEDAPKAPAKKMPTLSGWVHVVGCPHIGDKIGQNNVVLWFNDGESVAIDLNKTTEEHRADLSKYIGQTKGYTYVAKCEIAT